MRQVHKQQRPQISAPCRYSHRALLDEGASDLLPRRQVTAQAIYGGRRPASVGTRRTGGAAYRHLPTMLGRSLSDTQRATDRPGTSFSAYLPPVRARSRVTAKPPPLRLAGKQTLPYRPAAL